ncbi:MAG TPA: TadE/TadG family type IV pilus assembly protein [Noviherbaspirillum sp.]|jgi:Flp pilus assembly protein TadG|uniref:TadE/TadG family type IV pilus assembly protein n=1 Tax=Noviherbaspirillum sp. TaxID=1926288 RepID=UPI002F944061
MSRAALSRRPRGRRGEHGASVVEFALVAPVLFFFLCGIVEMCVLFWVNLTMQHVTREAARYAVTGRSDLDPDAARPQRHVAVLERIRASSMGLYERLRPVVNGVAYGRNAQDYASLFGEPGQVFVLKIDCAWPVMTPLLKPFFQDGTYRFSVATTMRNEAF